MSITSKLDIQKHQELIEKLDQCVEAAQPKNEQHKKELELQLDKVEFELQKFCRNKLFDKSSYFNSKLQ